MKASIARFVTGVMFLITMIAVTNCATLHTQTCDQFCATQNMYCAEDGLPKYYKSVKATRNTWSVHCSGKEDCARNKAAKKAYFDKLVLNDLEKYSHYQCKEPTNRKQALAVEESYTEVSEIQSQRETEIKYFTKFINWVWRFI